MDRRTAKQAAREIAAGILEGVIGSGFYDERYSDQDNEKVIEAMKQIIARLRKK